MFPRRPEQHPAIPVLIPMFFKEALCSDEPKHNTVCKLRVVFSSSEQLFNHVSSP